MVSLFDYQIQKVQPNIFVNGPTPRVELLDGKVYVGGSLDGSSALLWHLLSSWSCLSAVSMVHPELVLQAVQGAFDIPNRFRTTRDLKVWSKYFDWSYEPDRFRSPNPIIINNIKDHFTRGLDKAEELELLGPDVAVKFGRDALTPSLFIFERRSKSIFDFYFDSVPEIVVEFLPVPNVDMYLDKYLLSGVKECWLLNTENQHLRVIGLDGGRRKTLFSGGRGEFCSRVFPRLSVKVNDLWLSSDENSGSAVGLKHRKKKNRISEVDKIVFDNGIRHGPVPFDPRVELEPVTVSFAEFISWSPEACFKTLNEQLIVETIDGTRNMIGLLLMSLGLKEVVKLFHPSIWIETAEKRQKELAEWETTRNLMLNAAVRAASALKTRFGAQRVAVFGDLLDKTPFNFWSKVSIVFWGGLDGDEAVTEAAEEVFEAFPGRFELVQFDRLAPTRQTEVIEHCLELV